MRQTYWGIDLGGTKTEGVVLDHEGQVVWRERIATEADQGYRHILGRIAALVGMMESAHGPRPARIGVGTPGAVRPNGLMKNCNTVCLNGQPLAQDLARQLGVEVVVANDADCFALAEATQGAGRGHRVVFGVIMGTGVGGGIVVEGRLVSGPNGLSGEWGHMTLDSNGPACYCGRRGCVETYLSGPAVERRHLESTGQALSLREIAQRADTDAGCAITVADMCSFFGQSLAQVVNVLDPDVIVLGGGAGQVAQLLTIGREQVRRHVFGPDFATPLVHPECGDSAGVIGAALLVSN